LVYYIERGTEAECLEKRVPRKIFEPKGEKITWKWRRLHKEEIY
jgi:hypothetical protein